MLPATVEKRTNTGVCSPGRWNRSARGEVGQRLVGLEEAVGAEPAGVHDALGDALVVEVEDLLAEVEVLEQRRTPLAGPQRVLVVGDRDALLRRQPRSCAGRDLVGLAARSGLVDQRGGVDVGAGRVDSRHRLLASSARCGCVDERRGDDEADFLAGMGDLRFERTAPVATQRDADINRTAPRWLATSPVHLERGTDSDDDEPGSMHGGVW